MGLEKDPISHFNELRTKQMEGKGWKTKENFSELGKKIFHSDDERLHPNHTEQGPQNLF